MVIFETVILLCCSENYTLTVTEEMKLRDTETSGSPYSFTSNMRDMHETYQIPKKAKGVQAFTLIGGALQGIYIF